MSTTSLDLRTLAIANDTYITSTFVKSNKGIDNTKLQKAINVYSEEDSLEPYFVLKNEGTNTEPSWTITYSTASDQSGTVYLSEITNGMDAVNAAFAGLPKSRSTKLKVRVDNDLCTNEVSTVDANNTYGTLCITLGSYYAINVPNYAILDFNGNTIYANTTDSAKVIPISVFGSKYASVRNLNIEGTAKFAVWVQGVNNCVFDNIKITGTTDTTAGLRIAFKGTVKSSNIVVNKVTVSGIGGNGIEMYDVNGALVGTATVSDCTGSGLYISGTKNIALNTLTCTNCSPDTKMHAAVYCTKACASNLHLGTINATACARGLLIDSSSSGVTVNTLNNSNSYAQAILLADALNTLVLGGTLAAGSNNAEMAVQIIKQSSTTLATNKDNTFRNLKIKDYKYGFYQVGTNISTGTTITTIRYSNVTYKTYGI